MRPPQLFVALAATVALFAASPANAQEPPAHIASVDGSATVYHAPDRVTGDPNGALPDSEPAVMNMPIVQGDRVRTGERARVEVMFPDGGGIALESNSEVEFVTTTRVRVLAGEVEHIAAQPVDPRSPSAQNLPPDLQPYSPQFDQNGSWQNEPQYGTVWYPTTVSTDWRPYYDGYWSTYPAYGWTWIGFEQWAWPTHHYGRWGYAHSRWFWIPGHSYSSAWVSWGTAPGYVSWCPLGYDGRAVVGLSAGFHNSGHAWTVIPRDQFGARGYSVRRYAVEPTRVAATVPFIEHRSAPARQPRGSFSVAGPTPRTQPDTISRSMGVAVPRGQAAAEINNAPPGVSYSRRREVQPVNPPNSGSRAVERSPVEHPAYQPRYAPRYQPGYEPNYQAPQREPRVAQPRYETRPTPEQRPSVQPRREAREVAAPPAASPPASRAASPQQPRNSERTSSPPAREPHGGHGRESGSGSSGGTAVRRPR